MASKLLKRLLGRTLPTLALLVVLFAALYLASSTTSDIEGAGRFYITILIATGLALTILLIAIAMRAWRLSQQLRSGVAGSRLTVRLVLLFVALAVPPATIVYGFSIDFLSRKIDSWFDVEVESALDDAIVIAQSFLELQKRDAGTKITSLAPRLELIDSDDLIAALSSMAQESRALELTVFDRRNRAVATGSAILSAGLPSPPDELSAVQARQFGLYVNEEPDGRGGLRIRALAPFESPTRRGQEWIVQGLFPVTAGFDQRAANVENQLQHYKTLKFQRRDLRLTFVLVLSMVLLLSVLLAVLLAFNTARKLVMPIGRLSRATDAVARGDYRRHIEAIGDDELAFLVRSFNAMTDRIAQASDEAERSRVEAEQRRDYLEAVLGRLSSAVMSLDSTGRVLTSNATASSVLGVDMSRMLGRPLPDMVDERPELALLAESVVTHFGEAEWRQEVTIEHADRQRVFVCRGARLARGPDAGQVVVIDEVTDLVRAQRQAAWGEVARRLAHEVKNPLTPIQLAAERIRRRYLDKFDDQEGDVLDRGTRTIVAQVEALKTMVNAFSDYARAPTLHLEPGRVSEIVEQVLDLYRQDERFRCEAEWIADEPRVLVDHGRIRQLLHNLIKNAIEATSDDLLLTVANHVEWERDRPWLALSIRDNGPGLPRDIVDKLFEPYSTTKERGTGIGLAIVKKIAEEHGGRVQARNVKGGGALVELLLPIDPAELGGRP